MIKTVEQKITDGDYKKAWLEVLPAPEHTFEWDEHPEDYEDACCCALCRSYAIADSD